MSDNAALNSADEAATAANRAFNIQLWTLYAVGMLMTILRTYAQWKNVGWRNFHVDDYLIWVAALFYSCQSALAYSIGTFAQSLANNSMTDEQRAALTSNDPEYDLRVLGSKIQVAGWTCYSILIGLLKLSMLIFYIRLTDGLSSRYRMPIWIGFGLVGITIVVSILAIMLSCHPFEGYWQIYPDPGNACQAAISKPIIWTTFSSNVVTDLYLIAIPLPLLWESRLRMVNKIVASIVLGAGIFVLVCAALKTIFVFEDSANGAQLAGEWGTREAFVAVCTTNLPLIFSLLKKWLKPLFGNVLRSSAHTPKYNFPDGFQTIGGGNGDSHGRRYRKGGLSNRTVATAGVSMNGSEERIVTDVKMQNLGIAVSSVPDNLPSHRIMVSNEVQVVSEDRNNQKEDHCQYVQESWRPAGL
ncbi:hypothetical protein BKA67DRAFT_656537 [Truncatella angustata]|uniref:Rhodopsin domain-containing protein n=1 Tax=Truncatella angustata TaxID=152316 RepID=A0A9P9A1Q4_9PEZI|nr:uncharacterized protein BKA67DRAFT_656537 [Truncatella angustata]KAH6658339.1 hypothetical protein BKA67DRAFT_656537 [Truncatella angustata]KAH8200818.1 hypothetical protein TruAng_005055 [Truncatella angustata]